MQLTHRENRMEDEHSPYWEPPQTSTLDFLSAVARGFLFAAAIAMFLTLLGCDDYERRVRIQEWKDRFVNGCMPRKGDTVTAQWVDGNLICKRITPSARYGRGFPHVEVRVATVDDIEL
jgi:hypothetical protein